MSALGGRLIGVGVGPGDPDLVTVLAIRRLREAGTILVPVTDPPPEGDADAAGRAEAIVRAHLPSDRWPKVRRVAFAMGGARVEAARRAAAAAAIEALDANDGPVAFATIGDPNVYSTFTYLARAVRELRPETIIETIPGITAMQYLSARAGVPLCEGDQTLALVPVTATLGTYRAALAAADTVVAYKAGRRLPQTLAALAATNRLGGAIVGTELGLANETITRVSEVDPSASASYLTTVIAPPARQGSPE